jgi:hypothetical protein
MTAGVGIALIVAGYGIVVAVAVALMVPGSRASRVEEAHEAEVDLREAGERVTVAVAEAIVAAEYHRYLTDTAAP